VRSHVVSESYRLEALSTIEDVIPDQCPWVRSRPDGRRGQPRGPKLRVRPKSARSIRALQAREMTERVNASESLLMPRHRWPRGWDAMPGCRTGRWEAAGGGWSALISRVGTTRPGVEEAPDPVATHACGTRKPRQGPAVAGTPTARKAELRGGNRTVQQAKAGSRKATRNRDNRVAPPAAVPHNWPDTGPGARPERALTWTG
jgi:hypothetical protein